MSKGLVLKGLTEQGCLVIKGFVKDLRKARLASTWKALVVSESPLVVELYPSGVLRLSWGVADKSFVIHHLNKLFLEHNAVVKIDYELEELMKNE
jgi:hypothetical protein